MTHIAMDVHKKRSTLAYVAPGQEEVEVVRCYTTRKDFERVLGDLPGPWVVCIESSRQSPAVVRWLRDIGVEELHLVDATELARFTQGKPKSDRRDATEMLDLHLIGRLPECYLATRKVQEFRALSRGRTFVRKQATATRNQIRALLNQVGLEVTYKDLHGAAAQQSLGELVEQLEAAEPLLASMLRQLLMLLAVLEEMIGGLDRQIRDEASGQEVAQALKQLPGIGDVLAFGFLAEIGQIDRCESPANLISMSGLAPRARDSDDHRGVRKLPQRCNKRLRHLAVQAAMSACNSRESSSAKRAYQRVVDRLGPNTARIVAARALMKDIFYIWNRAASSLSEAA